MKAITYQINPLGWVTCKGLRYLWGGCLTSRLNGLRLIETDPPPLPADDWVRVRTRLGGICGSDLALLAQKQPPDSILQAFSSMPMILGHENLAVVEQVGPAVDGSWLGRRVCVEPTLCCSVRGIDPPCARCRAGEFGACEHFADAASGPAHVPPGTSIGYNRLTGGSFGEYFLAHKSQLVAVPDEIDDETATLTDPAACAVHAVLQADLADADSVLVYGVGVIGLLLVAGLRALGYPGRIDALGRWDYLGPLAETMGADEFLQLGGHPAERFARIAQRTGGSVQRVRFGNDMLTGGYDAVFDCVGSRASLTESLKWTRSHGQTVLVATGHGRGVDLTPIWFSELKVRGAYGRQMEVYGGRRIGTYQLTHELMTAGKLPVRPLLTHTFRLNDYRRALKVGLNKGPNRAVKVAFDFR